MAAVATTFAACSQDEDFAPQASDIVQIASAHIAAEVQTRANTEEKGDTWTNGDEILLVNSSRSDRNSGTYTATVATDGSATWAPATGLVLYASGTDEKNLFNAYYPAALDADYTLPNNQSEIADLRKADRMKATATDVAKSSPVSLNFERQHAKVTVTPSVDYGTEYGDTRPTITALTIGDITPYKSGDSYIAILSPTDGTDALEIRLTVTVDGVETPLTASAPGALQKGKHYSYSLKVGKDVATFSGVEVEPGGTGTDPEIDKSEEIWYSVAVSGTAATVEFFSTATAAHAGEAIKEVYQKNSAVTDIVVTTALTADQQAALATALTGKTVTLYLPQVTTASLADALQNDTDNITVNCPFTDASKAGKGDVVLLNGAFVSKDHLDMMADYITTPAGIVFWTTAETTTEGRTTPSKLTDDEIMATDFPGCTHGLIVSLKNVSTGTVWQSTDADIATWQSSDSFTAENKSDYKSIASGTTTATDFRNYILGYQNTKLLKAYNAQCEEANKVLPVSLLDEFSTSNPAPAHTTGWFIPSAKELYMLCYKDVDDIANIGGESTDKVDTKNLINTSLSAVGGDVFGDNYYWSSTETTYFGQVKAFGVYFKDADTYSTSKSDANNTDYVRAVCAY